MAYTVNGGSVNNAEVLSPADAKPITFANPNWISPGDKMFINIAMSSDQAGTMLSRHPSVSLTAGSGPEVELVSGAATYSDIYHSLPEIIDNRVGGGRMTTIGNDVYQVEICGADGIDGIGFVPADWTIQITNNDPLDRYLTWVVADDEDDARQPWMEVPPSLDFADLGIILSGQSVPYPDSVVITNRGTGTLTVTDPFGVLDTRDESGAAPASGGFNIPDPGAAISIAPNSFHELTIHFDAPAVPGTYTASVEFEGDPGALADPGVAHNKQATLTAACRTLEVVMVLDGSGSMSLTPDGSLPAAVPEDSRWGGLKDAVSQFLDLLGDFSGGLGRLGVVLFPDISRADDPADLFTTPTSHVLRSAAPFILNDISTITVGLDGLGPVGRTPMGEGVAGAMGAAAASFGEFLDLTTANALDDNNCRWMVLMSDGAHNLGPPHPDDFCGEDDISFKGKKIHVFGVAYGNPGSTPWPPHEQMGRLASASQGIPMTADAGTFSLRKAFCEAIVATLALDPTTDPPGTLSADRPKSRHLVNILPHETQAAFVVNWGQYNPERVSVQLVTPLCETITPDGAAREAHIRYHGRPRYAIYTVFRDYLRNALEPDHPRYGQWALIVTGHGLTDDDQEAYTFDVITRSGLRMQPQFDRPRYCAGDAITISVSLRLNGQPLPDAIVSVRMQAPGGWAQNWFARQTVSPKEFQQAKTQLEGRDVTDLDIKTHAVLEKGGKFETVARHADVKMAEIAGKGVYSVVFTCTEVPGTYTFHITAVGHTREGLPFRRERQIQQIVDVRPAANATFYHAAYRKIDEGTGDCLQIDLRVWPRDPFNNVLLSPSGLGRQIALTVQGKPPREPLKDNLDGSYSGVFHCAVDARPDLHLSIKGRAVISSRRLPPVARLHYADEVLEFKPGSIAGGESGQHDNPQDALGDVTLKGNDAYVSLGISGSLTLGIKGRAIFACEEDDVIVFVQLAEARGSYQVEALPVGTVCQWVVLGTSPGVTRSFSLRSAGIRAAKAIRISDRRPPGTPGQSRRGTDSGTAILGMGVGKAGPIPGWGFGCLAWPLAILRRLAGSR